MPHDDEATRKAIVSAYNRMYAAKNRERIKAKTREHYLKNREAILARNRARVEAWHQENPEAVREHKRRYREKNPEKLKEAHRKYIRDENGEMTEAYKQRLQVKTAQWRQDLETMAGRPRPEVCDACGGPPDSNKGMHFDHCHRHGHFRGWLCRGCNLVLGYVKDDPDRLRKLIAYLKRTKEGAVSQFHLSGL